MSGRRIEACGYWLRPRTFATKFVANACGIRSHFLTRFSNAATSGGELNEQRDVAVPPRCYSSLK